MEHIKQINETTGPAKTGITPDLLHKWIAANGPTDAQAKALWAVRSKWDHMEQPYTDTLMGCIMVNVGSMFLGIEHDGYTHS